MSERTFTQDEVNELIGKTKRELKDKHEKALQDLKKDNETARSDYDNLKKEYTESMKIVDELRNDVNSFKLESKQKEFRTKLSEMNVPSSRIEALLETADILNISDFDKFKEFAESPLKTPEPDKEDEDDTANLKIDEDNFYNDWIDELK